MNISKSIARERKHSKRKYGAVDTYQQDHKAERKRERELKKAREEKEKLVEIAS